MMMIFVMSMIIERLLIEPPPKINDQAATDLIGELDSVAVDLKQRIDEFITQEQVDNNLLNQIRSDYQKYQRERNLILATIYQFSSLAKTEENKCNAELLLENIRQFGEPGYYDMCECWVDESQFPKIIDDESLSLRFRVELATELHSFYRLELSHVKLAQKIKNLKLTTIPKKITYRALTDSVFFITQA